MPPDPSDPAPIRIRPFRPADRAAVVRLWEACGLTRPWNEPDADIARVRASGTAALFVGCEPAAARAGAGAGRRGEGPVVASVMAGSDGHRGWMYYLAVSPHAARRGVGRAMVRHAERWLAARGVRKVNLMIREENASAQAFYERAGYAREARVVMARWLGDRAGQAQAAGGGGGGEG